jgi:hypothetical protein
MLTFLIWYTIISYAVGLVLFWVGAVGLYYAQKRTTRDLSEYLVFGIILLLLSPLTAWHGVLHYAAVLWSRLTHQPLKFWI